MQGEASTGVWRGGEEMMGGVGSRMEERGGEGEDYSRVKHHIATAQVHSGQSDRKAHIRLIPSCSHPQVTNFHNQLTHM